MNPYFYSPYKMLNKSVLSILIVFGLSLVFLTLKYEVAFAEESSDSFGQKIVSLVKHNKLQEAMTETDEFIYKHKNEKNWLSWGYNMKGVIFLKMHEYTKAIYAYEESIKYIDVEGNNGRSITLLNIGGLQHRLGDYTEAISHYEKSIQVMDNNDAMLYKLNKMLVALSAFYLSQGRNTTILKQVYEETIKPMLHEIEYSQNPDLKRTTYEIAARIAFQLGRFDEVIQLRKTLLNINKNELTLENIDSTRLVLAIALLYSGKEVEADDVFRNVLWRSVSKDFLALWYWLKGDEMLARRYLEEYFAEDCSSDIARGNLRGIIRRSEILLYDMWKEARKQKWFRDLVYTNTLDYSTEKYAEPPEQETQEGIKTYSIENQEKDSLTTVFATNVSNVFHKPDCSKLNASDGLKEFDTPQKASEAGCLPCNYCKP